MEKSILSVVYQEILKITYGVFKSEMTSLAPYLKFALTQYFWKLQTSSFVVVETNKSIVSVV